MNETPFDPDAQRRAALAAHLRETLDLIKEYEESIRLGSDPKEVERCKHELSRLRGLLQGYQAEYAALTGRERPLPAATGVLLFPDAWLAGLPQPLAAAGAACNRAADATARCLALDVLLQVVVKFLAAVALAQYRKEQPRAAPLRPWLLRLSRHHLSEWAALLEELAAHYAAQAEPPRVIAALLDAYGRPLVQGAALETLYRELGARLSGEMVDRPTLGDLIGCLVAYRERTWESGVAHLPPDFVAGLLSLLPPALREWLDGCALLRDYPLRYLETARPSAAGCQCELADWRGPGERPVRVAATFPGQYKARRLYLCAPNGQPLVNLHPLLIHYQDALYFLEAWGEDEELTFRPGSGGPALPAPEGLRASLGSILQEDAAGPDLAALEEQVEQMECAALPPVPPPPPVEPAPPQPWLALLTRLSPAARQALEIALGEALRIGQRWLGVEFLLMGLSKQQDGLLGEILRGLGVAPGDFRGALRGLVGVAVQGSGWKRADVAALGAAALPQVQAADPATLAALSGMDPMPPAVVTPRMVAVLRQAAELAGAGQIEPGHLLLAALHHPQCVAVNLLLGLAHKQGHDPRELLAYVQRQVGAPAPEGSPLYRRPGGNLPGV